MKDSKNASLEDLWSLAVGAFLIIIGAAFFARVVFAIRQTKVNEKSTFDEVILNCQIQDENQTSDLIIIKDALARYNQETSFLIHKIKTNKTYGTIQKYSYFQSAPEDVSIDFIDKSERAQMLGAFYELMDNYPSLPLNNNLTEEDIHSYYEANKVHHQKVVYLAECLLPELFDSLNEVEIKTKSMC